MSTTHPPHLISHRSILLIAIVERSSSALPTPVALKYHHSPHLSSHDSLVSNARDALLASAQFVFPPDIPDPLSDPEPSSDDDHIPIVPPPLSPLSSTPSSPTIQHTHPIDAARTLPLSSPALYDALNESASAPLRNFLIPSAVDSQASRPRRANSLPRRPESSPQPRLRSLGLPVYTTNVNRRRHHSNIDHAASQASEWQKLSSVHRRRSFRHVLFSAKTHVFATTAKDGTRHYVYCRPLTNDIALTVTSTLSHTALYLSAMEHTAARYALLVDEGRGHLSRRGKSKRVPNGPRALEEHLSLKFADLELMRCPPKVAKELTKAFLDWLKAGATGGHSLATEGLLKRTRSRFLRDNPDMDDSMDMEVDDNSATWLTSSTASSRCSTNTRDGTGASGRLEESAQSAARCDPQERELLRYFVRRDASAGGSSTNGSGGVRSKGVLPWEAVSDGEQGDTMLVKRVLELTDATVLFRHLPVRAIISVVVALLEERRVCVIGQDNAVVSRAVLAFDNFLRPFEWPHLLSPILLEHMLPVLGAPFPYLVGIVSEHHEQALGLPLDEVVFVDLETGKVTTTDDVGDLLKRVPRRIRARLERRLTRAKSACARQVARSMSSFFVPSVSNTATSYFEDDSYDLFAEKPRSGGSLLWRSRSFRSLNEVMPQNIWLEHETVVALDRSMRKFFAELLEDLPTLKKEEDAAEAMPALEGGFKLSAPSRRETDRRLGRAFCRTQMFMQWEDQGGCDETFGITQGSSSVLAKRSSKRDILRRNATDEEPRESKAVTFAVMSDLECDEDISTPMQMDVTMVDVPSRKKRFHQRRKSRRGRVHTRLFSDAEEFSVDPRGMLSDVETSAWSMEEIPRKVHRRIVSSEFLPDVEADNVPKRPWLSLRLAANKWTNGRDGGDFTSGKLNEFAAEDLIERPDREATEVEESCQSDGDTDDGMESREAQMSATEATTYSKGRMRAWGRRHVRRTFRG